MIIGYAELTTFKMAAVVEYTLTSFVHSQNIRSSIHFSTFATALRCASVHILEFLHSKFAL